MVRIRPVNDHDRDVDWTVRKVSLDTLCIGDRKFSFDSVLDSKSNQTDLKKILLPLTQNPGSAIDRS